MTEDPAIEADLDPPRRRLWLALAGVVAFVILGVSIVPGLVRREPVPVELPAPAARAERGPAPAEPPAAQTPAAAEVEPALPLAGDGEGFDCMISPSEVVDLGSPITGVIEEIYVERSDYVEAGQVAARLESRVEEAAVRVARARARRTVEVESSRASLDLGQKRRARARKLHASNALSLDERQEIEAQTRIAALELERAREDRRLAALELERAMAALVRRTIRTPVSGFVTERLMSPGEVIEEQTLLRIAQVDPLRVEAILPSEWFGRTRPGTPAEIVPEAPLDQPRSAEVSIVDPVIDGASGTFGVHLLLPNPDHDLPAGLRCRVRFAASPAE